RLVLSLFLVSAGFSYCYGLIQVHFQDAARGELLPDDRANRAKFAGAAGMKTLERLLEAPEDRPFNASGTMRSAFFKRSAGWTGAIRKRGEKDRIDRHQAEQALREDRTMELEAVLGWIHSGDWTEDNYSKFLLPEKLQENKRLPDM